MNENEVYAKPPESLIEKAKEVVRQYYSCARCGIYNTRNILGDSMTTVFSENGLEIDVCFYWEYFEVFGLTSEEFAELEKFYSTLYRKVVTKK